ncbi:hypothetical protein HHK36_004915 [Tetracentron sinense]|uniref:Uncharacterized protein n=1 Tax=Tetracentron sinense TaxID=13715 RepID=A0A834ZT21_TETSI|nr:hypothetical protein HHK36_004915 [Tetracentron sinense]
MNQACLGEALQLLEQEPPGMVTLCLPQFLSFLRNEFCPTKLMLGGWRRRLWGEKPRPLVDEWESLVDEAWVFYPSMNSSLSQVCNAFRLLTSADNGSLDSWHDFDFYLNLSIGVLIPSLPVSSSSIGSTIYASSLRLLKSASDDGTVCIYDADPFVLLKTIAVHKKGVSDLSIHPSGKLALTVGRDSFLAMLNLVRGRRSFYCRLDKEASLVKFDLEGGRFFMVAEEKVSVHDSEDARLVFEMENQKRVLCAAPARNGLLFTGGEDRNVTAWDTKSGKVAYCIEDAHSARVKGIVVLNRNDGSDDSDDACIVASASSDGVVRVWDVRMAMKEKSNPLAEVNTKSRLTCLAGSSIKCE